jgi:streptogramin lyase
LALAACGGTSAPPDAGPVADAGPVDAGPPADAGPVVPTFKVFSVSPQPLYNLAIDAQGRVWAASELSVAAGQASVIRFDPATLEAVSFNVAGTSSAASVAGGLAVDAAGHVWTCTAPAAAGGPDDGSVALVELGADGAVLARQVNPAGVDAGACGALPCAARPFQAPRAVAIDAAQQRWVADQGTAGGPAYVTTLGASGFVRTAALAGTPYVHQLVLDAAGDAFTLDEDGLLLVKVTPAGAVTATPLPSRLYSNTLRMLIDPSGSLWVAATGNLAAGSVNKLSPAGADLGEFAVPHDGTADGIAIDRGGTVWVVDNTHKAVLAYDSTGRVVATYPGLPTEASPAVSRNMAVDAHGNLWITSASALGLTGTLIELPGVAAGPEAFPFAGPAFPY